MKFLTNVVRGCLPQDDLRDVGMQEWLGGHLCHVYLGYGFDVKEGCISNLEAAVDIPPLSAHAGTRDAAPAFLGSKS